MTRPDDAPSTPTPAPAPHPVLPLTEGSLVLLVGTSAAGKSTFARRHFRPTEVVSSDTCRALVGDDENDQSVTADAFELLHFLVGKRLAAGRLTVVDATNVQAGARKQLLAVAREHDARAEAIVLDVPLGVCAERNRTRPDRELPAFVIPRQHRELRASLPGLAKEGFRRVHVLRGAAEVAAAEVVLERRRVDLRHLTGPFDLVGDVHGCRSELETLLGRLGYRLVRDAAGRPVDAVPPAGRTAVFVGDLVDRGPDTPGVLRLVMGMVAAGHALCVSGNHELKVARALDGDRVTLSYGLRESMEQLGAEPAEFRAEVREFVRGLADHYLLDGGALVVCHAGLPERYHGRSSGRVRSHALYGGTTGETDDYGLPVRQAWAEEYRGRPLVVYGHTPLPVASFLHNTVCLDTGCVFGGALTALRYPERELVRVEAERRWYEPVRPLLSGAPGGREGRPLDVADVAGRQTVETALHGTVAVRPENAAAALETLGRSAVDPRLLVYLPPSVPPVAAGDRPGFAEHPDEAFAGYRADGVGRVLCAELMPGPRAVVLVARDDAALARRFGPAGPGAVWSRTGRALLGPVEEAELLARLRAAAERAGLFEELGSGWLLLEAALTGLPASAADAGPASAVSSAEDRRTRNAEVVASAGAFLPPVLAALERAAARGLDVAGLLDRQRGRAADLRDFAAVPRPAAAPGRPLLAPFRLLAAEGANLATGPEHEQLARIGRLVDADRTAPADPAVDRTTAVDRTAPADRTTATGGTAPAPALHRAAHRWVDTGDEASTAAAVAWWEELTAAGGAGIVVRPPVPPTRTASGEGRPRGLVQPAVRVRGREWLRLIQGPGHPDRSGHPDRPVRSSAGALGLRRSLALREYALGVEALDRLAAGEPLWRVHQAVFAVLALESEPVDPRARP
ncbi:polynucleotide 3'-phosphatase /polynucleotide 5'-hydroxyl-kinase /polynucleotide 2',3'-cyclic phosphate phosphodiesterase [Streptomyces sp. TLI_053]|uniref:polynucleotide kinase-phosphatase n=1 Tax=Streptomyces sp. TLI_053 TaxID=1855352 RepID=UPI00087941D6|nr:polynucleotide kinase-phosphatase [Streptomyces sp. TLI_053]SDT76432.1 polynucleotide 3'-phosphatase /polynucleotide 5'-hydroxyl-kinase /polynucleotide 2',3'-cyclic phosphate phosphodiesterase [Streptomyces sp. TLI_053]